MAAVAYQHRLPRGFGAADGAGQVDDREDGAIDVVGRLHRVVVAESGDLVDFPPPRYIPGVGRLAPDYCKIPHLECLPLGFPSP
eukprot:2349881-Pyramimonas_sp.AAC.1